MIEYKDLSEEIKNEFKMNGLVEVLDNRPISKEALPPGRTRFYPKERIEELILKAKKRETSYYGDTDIFLYEAFDKYPIKNKNVLIVGSTTPWYESICLTYEAKITVIDYNAINTDHPEVNYITVNEYKKNPKKFDVIVSISSWEHDGLGRYGDPINPNGDLEAMEDARKMLKNDGLMFLSVPSPHLFEGKDIIEWNLHRIYGKHRLPLLLKNYEVIEIFSKPRSLQPVFVLKTHQYML